MLKECKMPSVPRHPSNKRKTRKQSHRWSHWWKRIQKALWLFTYFIFFLRMTAFLSVLLSCPWADRKIHDSHGYREAEWNGMEIFAIYSHIQAHTHTTLFPQKQRLSIYWKKKIQNSSHCARLPECVSFPVLHQLWQLFPWWKGQHHSVTLIMDSLPCPLSRFLSFFLDVFVFFVQSIEWRATVIPCRYLSSFFEWPLMLLPVSRKWKWKINCSTKDSIDLLKLLSDALCSVSCCPQFSDCGDHQLL